MNSGDIRAAIRKSLSPDEWALFYEVPTTTGAVAPRRADAIAVNLWPSRGHTIHGFEIKISRSDWLREIKNPAKAEELFQRCDYWWIAAPKGVVLRSELPPTWGLYEVDGRGMTATVKAPRIDGDPFNRGFIASLLRQAQRQDAAEVRRLVDKEMAVHRASRSEEVRRITNEAHREHARLKERVEKFEIASGLKIDTFSDVAELGRIVALVQLIGRKESYRTVRAVHSEMKAVTASLGDQLDAFDDVQRRIDKISSTSTR